MGNRGKCIGGVQTVKDLRDRCRVDEATGCWMWSGCLEKGRPRVWVYALQRVIGGGAALALVTTGAPAPRGQVLVPQCDGGWRCLNPAHRQWGSLNSHLRGVRPSALHYARMVQAAQTGRRSKLTLEQRQEIRTSAEPVRDLAARYGMSESGIYHVRRKPVAAAASVFAWRPA